MVKLKLYVSTGIVGSEREEIIEIPDEELEGLTGNEKEEVFQEEFDTFMANHCDFGWFVLDEEEEK